MRDANIFSSKRCLPRMSWHPKNLYNLWCRSLGVRNEEINFRKQALTSLFKQRWVSKSLVRSYHGDHINEKIFKRYYLPATLPDVRPRKAKEDEDLAAWARRKERREEENDGEDKGDEVPPVASLMLTDVDRRVDVFVFRACFAHSVYEARRMVIHGDVKLNGKKHTNPNTRIAPGDMITVDPAAIRFLQKGVKGSTYWSGCTTPPPAGSHSAEDSAEDSTEPSTEPSAEASAEASAETSDSPSSTPADAERPPSAYEERVAKREGTAPSNLTPFALPAYASPWIFIPAYMEVSFAACSAIYVRHPTARALYSEIPTPYDADGPVIRLAWEWYTKIRPRIRSNKRLSREPENRTTPEGVKSPWL